MVIWRGGINISTIEELKIGMDVFREKCNEEKQTITDFYTRRFIDIISNKTCENAS